jgi:exonuclease VII small subunit
VSARSDLLDMLREKVRAPIEEHAGDILDSFAGDKEKISSFQKARADLDALIEKLEEEEFRSLRKELDAHGAELNAGIESLESSLKGIKDAETAARVFWRVVGLAARIIALA